MFSIIYFIHNISCTQSFPSQSRLRSVLVPLYKPNVVPGNNALNYEHFLFM